MEEDQGMKDGSCDEETDLSPKSAERREGVV
jgi:hypothetical protein